MKIRLSHYLLGLSVLAVGITAIAEENKIKPLTNESYKTLIDGFDKSKDCIFSRTINDWTALDDRRLLVYAPTKKRPYYVKLSRRSMDLKFAHSIGIYTKFDNRVCPYGGNALFIDGERYNIQAIQKLDKDTADQLRAFRDKKKTDKKKP